MTSKVYRTAQGKTVDLGTIMLKNEHVRAVGNMNVNARGDKLDSNNRVIETKPQQIQRQLSRTSNISTEPPQTSSVKAKRAKQADPVVKEPEAPVVEEEIVINETVVEEPLVEEPAVEETVMVAAPPVQDVTFKIPEGGLAAAMARSKEVKQELEKTRRQQAQAQGVRKI